MSTLQEKQLGQLRPANTTAASLYSPPAATTWIGKNLVVCNTTAGAITFRVFHDEDGTTYDTTTALYYDVSIAANTTLSLTGFLAGHTFGGNIGVRVSTGDTLTFTLYGATVS